MKCGTVKDEFSMYITILTYFLYWPIETQNNFIKNAYKIQALIKFSVTSVLYALVQCVTAYKNYENLANVLDTVFMTFTCVNYLVKTVCYLSYNEQIRLILEETGNDIFQTRNNKSTKIIFKSMGNWKIISRVYLALGIFAVLFYTLTPIIDKSEAKLPFGYWYPFDVNSTPVYELIYFYEVVGLFTLASCHISLDIMMVGIIAFIAGQIDVLNENLRKLNYSDSDDDKAALAAQIECFTLHRNIKRLVFTVNKILTFPMFTQSTLGAVILCTAMYKLSKVPLLSIDGISNIFYYVCMVTELVFYFWYGNEIIWKSYKIPDSAYECNWISSGKAFKTNLLLFMKLTVKPLQISGGYFVILSLNTLITILKCSWSYMALLKSM